MPGDEYLETLSAVASTDLDAAFGSALQAMPNRKWATTVGEGTASLAVLKPRGRVRLRTDLGKPRLTLSYPDAAANLSVADLRFYEANQSTVDDTVYNDVRARLARGVDAYKSTGSAWSIARRAMCLDPPAELRLQPSLDCQRYEPTHGRWKWRCA